MSEFTKEPSIILLEHTARKTRRYLTLNGTFKVIPYHIAQNKNTIFAEKPFVACAANEHYAPKFCGELSRKPQNLKIHETFHYTIQSSHILRS